MAQHVMVDLETLGVGTWPVILSIGAVRFDPEGDDIVSPAAYCGSVADAGTFFYCMIDIDSCRAAGAAIEGATLNWWMQPEQEPARKYSFPIGDSPTQSVPLSFVLREFHTWYDWSKREAEAIWGHGATFDVTILQSAYHAIGGTPPWGYRAPRDTRTLFSLAEPEWPANPVLHHPLWDAWCQAKAVQSSYRKLRAAKESAALP